MARAASATPISTEGTRPILLPGSHVGSEKAEGITFSDAARPILTAGSRCVDLSSRAIRRVRRAAHERPLYFVGGVAVASFLAGVALRVWRSRQYD